MTAQEPGQGRSGRTRGYDIEILLVSFAGLLLEIAYTRVVSFKFFYYYTYLVIGLALLGMGCGGVIVAISARMRRASTDAVLLAASLFGAGSVAVGYLIVAGASLNTRDIWRYTWDSSAGNVATLVLICLVLLTSFISIGVIVATLFARRPDRISRLYFADLVGAGIACAIAVALLGGIGPPATIFLSATVLALVGLRIAWRTSRLVALGAAVLAVALAVVVVVPDVLPDPQREQSKVATDQGPLLFSAWSPIFRVDVREQDEDVRLLYHDGLLGSAIYRWDGEEESLRTDFEFEIDPRSLPFAALGAPPRNEMIIGAAGGHEILASLRFGAEHIEAVELNPVTHELVTDRYSSFTGGLAEHPRVDYVHADGRSYLARSDERYDLIWYPAPDSYSATNAATSGAFVLSESYLYTSEALVESFEHLTDRGIVAAQFGEIAFDETPNRTMRYVSTARHALEAFGVEDPRDHIIVVTTTVKFGTVDFVLSTILVKTEPFTEQELANLTASMDQVPVSELRYAPGVDGLVGPVADLGAAPPGGEGEVLGAYPHEAGAITDDAPFFWHFNTFGTVLSDFTDPIAGFDPEDQVGQRVMLLLLAMVVLLAAVFLLAPFVFIRQIWTQLPRKGLSALYFVALGLGFMFFEITLIQKLVLFLGYPSYSLTVTLGSVLIFTGMGALLSGRVARVSRALVGLLVALAALTAFYLVGLPALTDALLGAPFTLRVVVALVVLAPLGLCLGMFMPLGLGAVSRLSAHPSEYVAWGWAVNGFASVTGSVLTTVLAMSFGFRTVLVVALVTYLVAAGVLVRLTNADREPADPVEPAGVPVAV